MAKAGPFSNNVGPILLDRSQKGGWVLCIGAGTSIPMVPDWNMLVERMVARDVGPKDAKALTCKLLAQYSPEALIQAAHDRIGCSDDEFFDIFSYEFYNDLRSCLSEQEWDFFSDMASAGLEEHDRYTWVSYLQMIRRHFPNLSSLQIAEVISETIGSHIAPEAILSFNAEPIMASLINAYLRVNKPASQEPGGEFRQRLDLITHSITNRRSQCIPYYFIHGLLPIPNSAEKQRMIGSVDKLVFSESEYLQLSNYAFSWQSSVFLDLTSTRSTVFIGVSLSDPNMRRWLSWTHSNRLKELKTQNNGFGESSIHYWITRLPETEEERLWVESSVEHLGVRIIWLEDWDQIYDVLRTMLGLAARQKTEE